MRGLALAVCAALAAGPADARAERPAAVVDALAGDTGGVESSTLIGHSGEVYLPRPGGWARDGAGGVAADVAGAARGRGDLLFAIGGWTPLYERIDRVWRVAPLGQRGPSRASTRSGVRGFSVGRTVYTLDSGAPRRLPVSLPGRIQSLWLESNTRVWAIDTAGRVLRSDGRRLAEVRAGLPETELPVALVGVAGRAPYVIGDAGTIVATTSRGGRPVTMAEPLPGFAPTAMTSDAKAVWLAGRAGERHVLAKLTGDTLTVASDLPALEPGDAYSLVAADADGKVLVVSWRGVARVRHPDGTWTERAIDLAPPPVPDVPIRKARKPARTR